MIKVIDGLYWNDDNALYCEGHVTPAEFLAALDPSYGKFTEADHRHIHQYWIRKVPDSTGEFTMKWMVANGPGRGIKAYTIFEGHR